MTAACTEKIAYQGAPALEVPDRSDTSKNGRAPSPDTEATIAPLTIDLGYVQTEKDITFDVPENALGFNIVAEASTYAFDPDAPFGIERITAPGGAVVFDGYTPVGGTSPTSITVYDSITAAAVPQSEAVPSRIPAGTWTVRYGRPFGGGVQSLDGRVVVQMSDDGAFHGGTLDLHLHLPKGVRVGGTVIDLQRAARSPELIAIVDAFFAMTSNLLGIERGEVTFQEAPSSLAVLDDAEIADGFAVSEGVKDGTQSLHVLFTNAIRQDGEEVAVGISPGIPGSANRYGRKLSGIIAVSDGTPEDDALTILHEAGHFVGLNHTTEFDGRSADPLGDTPRCATIDESDFDALDACPDATNVMFPAGPVVGLGELSPAQLRVYRGSPIYKHFKVAPPRAASRTVAAPSRPAVLRFRRSGLALNAVERELAAGFCGLTPVDAPGMVQRYGSRTEAELRAAAADPDLKPFMRGRARLALKALARP